MAFCTRFSISSPFPLTENLLCYFTAYLADEGLAPQTGKAYLSAIRNLQITLGLPDPRGQSPMPILKRVQAGVVRSRQPNPSPRKRLPITAPILASMGDTLMASSNPEKCVVWAVACTAFFGFFRLGELLPESAAAFNPAASLAWGDVAVDNHTAPRMVQIHLKRSKCDQAGAGSDIVLGVTGLHLCPVRALLRFIEIRGSQPGAFFLNSAHMPVTKPWFVTQIRELLASMGLQQQDYAGHSFRIGAATTAALAGLEDSLIQTLGRWHSAAFLQYIRTPKEQLAAVSKNLAQAGRSPGTTRAVQPDTQQQGPQ